jgi:predicted nuclease of predicted toxin-antitoxin system
VSADSDFGTIFARTRSTSPSVLFFRRGVGRRVEEIAALITENLELMEEPLREGSVVVLGEGSVRIRQLPIL